MKSFLILLFTVAVWAQPAPPQTASPGGVPDLPANTVVATFGDGQKLTAGELKSFLAAMPPNMQQAAARDRRAFVQQVAMMHRLAEVAEQAKLDQRSPTRESLAFNRMYVLMNAQLHEVLSGIVVAPAEAAAYYNKNKDRFIQVKVKTIYIPFAEKAAEAGAKQGKRLTEAEAESKIKKVRADIMAGADFVKMVAENSEDQTSVAKGGDFGTIRSTDNLPDAIRTAIFALKVHEVSEPVKQPNGFYLFRAEEISVQPLAEVQEELVNELKQAHFKQYMDDTTRSLNLKIQNDEFFMEGGGAQPASGR
jgi:parvulin-like peptidyl-prolyl isomerase